MPLAIINDNIEPLVTYKGENFTYECQIINLEEFDKFVHFVWGNTMVLMRLLKM